MSAVVLNYVATQPWTILDLPGWQFTSVCRVPEYSCWLAVARAAPGASFILKIFDDGTCVAVATPCNGKLYDVCWSSARHVAVAVGYADNGHVFVSEDLDSWVESPAPIGRWRGVAEQHDDPTAPTFVICGPLNADLTGGSIATSFDGKAWQPQAVIQTTWFSHVRMPGFQRWLMVGEIGVNHAQTSADGRLWDPRGVPIEKGWIGSAYSPTLQRALLVTEKDPGPRFMYTDDGGDTFTDVDAPGVNNWYSAAWAGGQIGAFFASSYVGTGRMAYSPTGAEGSWGVLSGLPDQDWRTIAYAHDREQLCVVGVDGKIAISASGRASPDWATGTITDWWSYFRWAREPDDGS